MTLMLAMSFLVGATVSFAKDDTTTKTTKKKKGKKDTTTTKM
jgi:hypothetical protein